MWNANGDNKASEAVRCYVRVEIPQAGKAPQIRNTNAKCLNVSSRSSCDKGIHEEASR